MIGFWILAAVMLAAALAVLIPPLLGRRQESHAARSELNLAVHRDRLIELERQLANGELDAARIEEARQEIERELLRDTGTAEGQSVRHASRRAAVVVAIAIPLATVGLYLQIGSPSSVEGLARAAAVPAGHDAPGAPSVEDLIAGLARRLQADPSNAQGWVMLGRSYGALERYAEAREAFAAADRLSPRDPEILTRLAEATALAADGDLEGRPEDLLREALAIRPELPTALWLAGLAASQRQAYGEAIRFWETLAGNVTDADEKATVTRYLEEARRQLGSAPAASPVVSASATPAIPSAPAVPHEAAGPAATGSLTVTVSLAPDLSDRAAAGDTVYIFARPAEGSRMPLAIVRKTVADLPASVTLDDGMAMTPGMKLSSFPQVVVGARVSKSGSPAPQSGDLEGLSEPLAPVGSPPVEIRIDRPI